MIKGTSIEESPTKTTPRVARAGGLAPAPTIPTNTFDSTGTFDSSMQCAATVGTNPAPAQLIRPRRLRAQAALRSMVQETHLHVDSLIMPYFIIEGTKRKLAIDPMPGIFQMSVDQALLK